MGADRQREVMQWGRQTQRGYVMGQTDRERLFNGEGEETDRGYAMWIADKERLRNGERGGERQTPRYFAKGKQTSRGYAMWGGGNRRGEVIQWGQTDRERLCNGTWTVGNHSEKIRSLARMSLHV